MEMQGLNQLYGTLKSNAMSQGVSKVTARKCFRFKVECHGITCVNYCSVIFVISGGQLIRNGTPTVPMPRVTYICEFPNLYNPQTYFEKRAAGHTIKFP